MRQLRPGQLIRYLPQPSWGVGDLVEVLEADRQAWASFPGRDEPVLLPSRADVLRPVVLEKGDKVVDDEGRQAEVVAALEVRDDLQYYRVLFADGSKEEVREDRLHAALPPSDMLSHLVAGTGGSAKAFALRRDGLKLDAERRTSALGALFASRVMPLPHQIAVVDRVLGARSPRFILADEVGLGKTIEAGMIYSALKLSGLAHRVLIVAPSHLTVQWLVEFAGKFNSLFTLMDGDRFKRAKAADPKKSPWRENPKIVTSLELLARTPKHIEEVTHRRARWDLVIIDEAHHLKGKQAFEMARKLARNTWGLLLLTATPMHLDPEAYHRMLELIEPDVAPSPSALATRLSRQQQVSQVVRSLEGGGKLAEAREALLELFPDDAHIAGAKKKEQLLEHLARHYSVSASLIRNRRAVVGGFTERRLHRHPVKPSAAEKKGRQAVIDAILGDGSLKGAPRARVLRSLESSTAALAEALTKRELDLDPVQLGLPEVDAKAERFLSLLEELDVGDRRTKVLTFTESRATQDFLEKLLTDRGMRCLTYHGDLGMVERDRRVARFRDEDGPPVLISTEVGGEGRNFQFAHHLICYDLPWSPGAMEQRIGRLDRVGQREPVEIHVLEPEGTLTAFVAELFDRAVGVFAEPVGGLDSVLEKVEQKIGELGVKGEKARAKFLEELAAEVSDARASLREAWDPLLDHRSCDLARVQAIADRAVERFELTEILEEETLPDRFWGLARDLDERLEDTVTLLARQVGLGVDLDENVDAFECAFNFGNRLKVDSLPGLSIAQERRELGTFWRETAVERDEISYFATGHPIVEALFAYLHDGEYGRVAWRRLKGRGKPQRGFHFVFELLPPEPEDTAPGALVASRHLARFMKTWMLEVAVSWGTDGKLKVDADLLSKLERAGDNLRGAQLDAIAPGREKIIPKAAQVAVKEAMKQLAALQDEAEQRIGAEAEERIEQLGHALSFQGVPAETIERQLGALAEHYRDLGDVLEQIDLDLDSVSGFVIGGD
ncbi:MAG: SNF2-related protein [Deltaproteobacteria bacterium]|nr:SNF2-related protein [Deltaproteobacteria bacterium]